MSTTTTATNASPSTAIQRLAQRLGLTVRPETFGEQFRNSSAVWLALMAYWVFSDVIIALFPPGGRPKTPDSALLHLGVTLAGLATIWCMHRVRIPAAWDARICAQKRLLLPTLVGAIFGVLLIGMELSFGLLRGFQEATGMTVTIGFPQSILVYSSIATFLEFQYLLLPLPLLLWLISGVVLRGRGLTPTFWVLAVLTSAIEPVFGVALLLGSPGSGGGALNLFALGVNMVISFGCNFAGAVLFRRYGLLAPILVRVSTYMVWHVFFGNFFL